VPYMQQPKVSTSKRKEQPSMKKSTIIKMVLTQPESQTGSVGKALIEAAKLAS
jgi:hypothetical protein